MNQTCAKCGWTGVGRGLVLAAKLRVLYLVAAIGLAGAYALEWVRGVPWWGVALILGLFFGSPVLAKLWDRCPSCGDRLPPIAR